VHCIDFRPTHLTLIFSDLHLGRSAIADAGLVESLSSCISAYAGELEEVILLGDVFDAYMEYPGRREPVIDVFSPVLELPALRDVRISYHVGNHDPWHLTYFRDAFGVLVIRRPVVRKLAGRETYLSHGDEEDAGGPWSRVLRHFMRQDFYFWLYRTVIPAPFGQKLPRFVSQKWGRTGVRDETVFALRTAARRIVDAGIAEVVVFGHSHRQEEVNWQDGSYLNVGSWFEDLSYLEVWPNSIVRANWANSRSMHQPVTGIAT